MPISTTTSNPNLKMSFPFLDLKAQYRALKVEIDQAIQRVMDSQQFILGPEVEALENEIAAYVGSQHAVACASGSDALLLALMALEVGAGDEVITTPFTFVATAGCVARLGAKPVFVDIDPLSYNLDPGKLEAAITARTKAIIPVHLYGMAADMDPIMEAARRRGVAVIEDAAQAIGATYAGRRVGSIGRCGAFSFFPSKNLGGAGDGGILTTDDASFADRLRVLHVHGGRSRYEYELLGINSRLDALQAAILRVKLRHLDSWNEGRRRVAATYQQLFKSRRLDSVITLPSQAPKCNHVYHQYVIRAPQRDALRAHLQARGVPSEIYYPHPLHLQPAFTNLGRHAGDLPHAENASLEVLALPIFPEISLQQQELVVEAIGSFYA